MTGGTVSSLQHGIGEGFGNGMNVTVGFLMDLKRNRGVEYLFFLISSNVHQRGGVLLGTIWRRCGI